MKAFYLSILMALALLPAHAQRRYNAMRETKKEFFKTEQARLIGDQILDYQRVTGGWPKFWPGMRGYQVHITFNDDAMVNTMEMLRDIYLQKAPFDGKLTDKALDPFPWDCAYIIMVANAREATADGCATISTRLLAIQPSMTLLPFGPLMANGIPKHASETCVCFKIPNKIRTFSAAIHVLLFFKIELRKNPSPFIFPSESPVFISVSRGK